MYVYWYNAKRNNKEQRILLLLPVISASLNTVRTTICHVFQQSTNAHTTLYSFSLIKS